MNLDLLIQLLEEDYLLVTAGDGIQALQLARREQPDAVLMDMALPVMDGWEATRQIKADPALSHIPVIGISSHAMSGDAERARQAGCDDYLTKPLDENVLFAVLEKYL